MKKGALLGTSVLATGGVVGGGVLLSGALNNSGAGDKSAKRLEDMDVGETEEVSGQQGPDGLSEPELSRDENLHDFSFPSDPDPLPDDFDHASEYEDEFLEDDEDETTIAPWTVDDTHELEVSSVQSRTDEDVDYTITESSLMLQESCGNQPNVAFRGLISFLDMENSSFEDNMINLTKAEQYLQNLIASDSYSFQARFSQYNSSTCEDLHTHYKKWLWLWNQKITSAGDDSESWKQMRDKYVDILKEKFWNVFEQEDGDSVPGEVGRAHGNLT